MEDFKMGNIPFIFSLGCLCFAYSPLYAIVTGFLDPPTVGASCTLKLVGQQFLMKVVVMFGNRYLFSLIIC